MYVLFHFLVSLFLICRYQLVQSFLHFAKNEERVTRGQPGYTPLFKVAPLMERVIPTNTTPVEMKAFTGLQVTMGMVLVTTPGILMYWEESWLVGTPGFRTVMSRN